MGNPKIWEYSKDYQFGKPGGNIPNGGGVKGGGKTMRQRLGEIMNMEDDEMKAYAEDVKNPAFLRKAAKIMLEVTSVKELSMATDMIESKPVQIIDNRITELPPIMQPIDLQDETNEGLCEDTEVK